MTPPAEAPRETRTWITELIASELGDVLAEEAAGNYPDAASVQRRAEACATHILARLGASDAEPYYRAIHDPRCAFRQAGAPHPCTCAELTPELSHV